LKPGEKDLSTKEPVTKPKVTVSKLAIPKTGMKSVMTKTEEEKKNDKLNSVN
jgi:hypothetical protein